MIFGNVQQHLQMIPPEERKFFDEVISQLSSKQQGLLFILLAKCNKENRVVVGKDAEAMLIKLKDAGLVSISSLGISGYSVSVLANQPHLVRVLRRECKRSFIQRKDRPNRFERLSKYRKKHSYNHVM